MVWVPAASRTVQNEDADLFVEVEGDGPPLLLVPGAGGSGARFAMLANQLADRFTVIRYDRRANGRSGGDRDAPFDMMQQARDAAAVIRSVAVTAIVVGTSGGANIALQLAAQEPRRVTRLLVHEPPILALLDDGADIAREQAGIEEAARREGIPAALRLFMAKLVGVPRPSSAPPPDEAVTAAFSRFFGREFRGIGAFDPDLDALATSGIPITVMAGRDSGDAFYARAAEELAARLGLPLTRVPGHHLSFAIDPRALTRDLHEILL